MASQPIQTRMVVTGLDDTRKVIRDVAGKEGQKALGKVHKRIGERILIPALGGKDTGVGEGRGSKIRPSAASRQVTLRVGGKHREDKKEQWGQEQVWPPPDRPHIIGTAVEHQDDIEREYRDGLMEELSRLP